MNAAALTAIRQIASEMQNGTDTMTAREMALTSHNCNRAGDIATTKDGRKWYWNEQAEVWMTAR